MIQARGVWLSSARRASRLLAAAALLASCGGSSSGPATGIYRGQSAAGNNVLAVVLSTGSFYVLYSPPANPGLVSLVNSGSGTPANGQFNAATILSVPLSFGAYTQGTIGNGSFASTYVSGSTLNGTFSYLPSGSSTITMAYDATSTAAATVAQVARSYSGTFSFYYPSGTNLYTYTPTTTFTVSPDGSISGTVACWTTPVCTSAPCPTVTCTVTGSIAPRSDVDAYDTTLSIGSTTGGATPLDGTYSGVGYYDATTGNFDIAALSPSTNKAIGFK